MDMDNPKTEIDTALSILYNIAPMNTSNFTQNDNIMNVITDLIDSCLLALGNDFDEAISILLKKINVNINELKYKKIECNLPSDFSQKNKIKKYISDIITDANINYVDLEVKDTISKVNEIIHNSQINLDPFKISYDSAKELIDYISYLKDNAYECSKKVICDIKDRILYNFNNGEYLISKSSYQAISVIFFLMKYYSIIKETFTFILTSINDKLEKSLYTATT